VATREFREDLYFRLSVFPITVPPLRDRTGDIPILARHFVEHYCRDLNKQALHFAPSALEELGSYRWPGNVRELQNCIERAVILCDSDTIHPRHLNLSFRSASVVDPPEPAEGLESAPSSPADGRWAQIDLSGTMTDALRRVTADVERLKIAQALKDAGGNKERAAEALQVSYKAFLQKQREHGIAD
jgi:DNA-binding NtrC family response regulator